MKNYQRDQEIKPFYCNSEVLGKGQKNICFIHDKRKKNCHSALTPHHESEHNGEVRLHAFLGLACERGEWCDFLYLNRMSFIANKDKKNVTIVYNEMVQMYFTTPHLQ